MVKNKKIKILLFVLFVFFSNNSTGQQVFTGSNSDSPIEISAEDGIEWHKNKKKYIAKGNAKARKADLLVTSNVLEAIYEDNNDTESEITVLKAKGNVFIKNQKAQIQGGKKARYNLKKEYFIVNGKKLELISNEDRLTSNSTIEFWKNENIAIATGKAKAHKNNKYSIFADKLVWHLIDDKEIGNKEKEGQGYQIKRILAYKNVVIETNNEIAYSNKALYNEISGICKLFGKVKLKKGDNFLTGEYAEMNLNTGISKLLPHPTKKTSETENRVKALIKKNE